ncbi:helix-hairpin-helix domain-containing protein [Gammaproteobacteria bacterium]|jgi:competence protein ComEA|nr:helix-hairpin-helix domain-containing protein [Gammaproteobacteria bacterium]|tara:strand:- start:77 stop:397 length:321 start_codon:yes stop_codon:yes gene_type:complete
MKTQIRLFVLLLAGLVALASNLTVADEMMDKSSVKAMLLEPMAVNINTASAEDMAQSLKGIGIKTAQAIVAHRDSEGLFESPESIVQVKGIGDFTYEANKDAIMVE